MLKRRYKKILLGVLGAWALISLVATAPGMIELWRQKKVVERAFSGYAAALVNEKFEEAYGYCGKDFREATPFEAFVSQQRALRSKFGTLKLVKQEGIEVSGRGSPTRWRAVINAGLEYETKTLGFTYEFRFEDGHWTLLGYKQM